MTANEMEILSKQEMEEKHFQSVINAFASYRRHSSAILMQKLKSAKKILFSNHALEKASNHAQEKPSNHALEKASNHAQEKPSKSAQEKPSKTAQEIGPDQADSLSTRDVPLFKVVIERLKSHLALINYNAHFLNTVIENHPVFMENSSIDVEKAQQEKIDSINQDKVKSTLKQLVRDWSLEGKEERDKTYRPFLDELDALYQNVPVENRGSIKVLVPGAGLGRLVYEVVCKGFACQGNEFSFFMLLASNYIVNHVQQPLSIPIYPWIHQHSNMPSKDVQTAQVLIPDVLCSTGVPSTANFSMVAGDFIEVYSEPHQIGAWDVILTCFFIDTNKNFLQYLKVIQKALKPGGKWINLGPLLYHFEGQEDTIEFTLEEIKFLVVKYGFTIEKEARIDTVYAACPETMMNYTYHNHFFVATKNAP